MKRFLSILLCIAILTTLFTVASADTNTTQKMTITVDYVNIVVNSQKIWMHNFVHEGTTYIGLRDAGNAFGYEVNWEDTTKTATFNSGAEPNLITEIPDVEYYVTEKEALVNYANIVIDGIPVDVRNFIFEGTTYVALRDLGTLFKYNVNWDESTRTAFLDKLALDYSKISGQVDGVEIPSYLIKVEGQNALASATSIDEVRDAITNGALIYAFVEKQKSLYNISVPEEQKKLISDSFDNIVASEFGGKEVLEIILAQENITYDEYKNYYSTVTEYDVIYSLIAEKLLADESILSADKEAALKYYNDNIELFKKPAVRVKHILFPTINPNTGEPLSDKEKAAAKTSASSVYNQLKWSPNSFDSFIPRYNNDPGMPETGYLIYENSGMVLEFEEASLKLGKNQISPIIETAYGYHIIKAIDTYDTLPFDELYSFNADNYISNMFMSWSELAVSTFNW